MKHADLKKQLLNQIDVNDQLELEKVERYLDLVKLYRKMNSAINKFGAMIEVENGSQKFVKPNPAIAEKIKISRAIIALGKDLNLDDASKIFTDNEDDYSESDLT
ncbi:P27 family phage terminase small subunit [Enterococcus mundtii]|uniref:P27 family phage terminase small subunit n=1 Tax=Enterococcus mundtii TaxID=53346 RepID=UPI00115896CE|nr:P27 family phage terminase small subunit [Enterococcus mundtii]